MSPWDAYVATWFVFNDFWQSSINRITSYNVCYTKLLRLKKVPTAEDTYEGGEFAGGRDVRYWSFCTGGLGETGTPACLCDDQTTQNPDGSLTIVIAPFYLQPAIKRAGLNYMKWGTVYKPILIHRHMLERDSFSGKIGNVNPIGRPPAVADRNQAYMNANRAANWMGDRNNFV